MKNKKILGATIFSLSTIFMLGACGITHQEDFPVDGPEKVAKSNPQVITEKDLGHQWPFDKKVESVEISCLKADNDDVILRVKTPDGKEYALNGVEDNKDLPSISEITTSGIGGLRTFGFTVCDVK